MAKKSIIENNRKRAALIKRYTLKRKRLKSIIEDKKLGQEERFRAQLKLSNMPRNSSKTRHRNRCEVTGRPRGYYRKLGLSRIHLRQMASSGLIPGMTKASW